MFGLSARVIGLVATLMLSATVSFAESVLAEAVKPAGSMKVLKLEKNRVADLLLIDAGMRDGIKAGLRLNLVGNDEIYGEVMVVESSLDKSVALILGELTTYRVQDAVVQFNIMK